MSLMIGRWLKRQPKKAVSILAALERERLRTNFVSWARKHFQDERFYHMVMEARDDLVLRQYPKVDSDGRKA